MARADQLALGVVGIEGFSICIFLLRFDIAVGGIGIAVGWRAGKTGIGQGRNLRRGLVSRDGAVAVCLLVM